MRFKPPLWSTVAALAAFSVLIALGYWQLDRAAQKQQRHLLFVQRYTSPPMALPEITAKAEIEALQWRRVRARGRYRDLHVLLDNRVRAGVAGVEVLTVFELNGGAQILVNRGWTSAPADRRLAPEVPVINGVVEIRGHAGPPPATGLRFDPEADHDETLAEHIIRVQWVEPAALNERYGLALAPFVIFLERAAPGGFARDWPEPGNEAQRHVAYAVQWFALAVILVVIYVSVNLTDRGRHADGQ
jgi:surfeit locus 1 family protein